MGKNPKCRNSVSIPLCPPCGFTHSQHINKLSLNFVFTRTEIFPLSLQLTQEKKWLKVALSTKGFQSLEWPANAMARHPCPCKVVSRHFVPPINQFFTKVNWDANRGSLLSGQNRSPGRADGLDRWFQKIPCFCRRQVNMHHTSTQMDPSLNSHMNSRRRVFGLSILAIVCNCCVVGTNRHKLSLPSR